MTPKRRPSSRFIAATTCESFYLLQAILDPQDYTLGHLSGCTIDVEAALKRNPHWRPVRKAVLRAAGALRTLEIPKTPKQLHAATAKQMTVAKSHTGANDDFVSLASHLFKRTDS